MDIVTKPQTQRDERYNFIEEIGREYGIEFGDLIYTFHCGQLVNEEIRIKRRLQRKKKRDQAGQPQQ